MFFNLTKLNNHKLFYFLAIIRILFAGNVILSANNSFAQAEDFSAIRTEVHFDETIRDWDGFGFNYVETAQTMDYDDDPQEYGGFSLLDEDEKMEIVNMVFGDEGLKVACTMSMDSEVAMIAFSSNRTENEDAYIVVNWSEEDKKISVTVTGTTSTKFNAFQTTEDESKLYSPSGNYTLTEDKIIFDSPKGSVTTFFGN